jgi:arylsulfatase A-like enzyme
MTRSLFLLWLAFDALLPIHAAETRPNLIVILADDLGWSDIGCYGSEIPTPHIDALAAGGMKFSALYNCAQCCPTRASLISGMYPHEAGVGDMIDDHPLAVREAAKSPHYSDRLDPRAKTIAEHLRPAGYQTYMTGKWHLGYADGQRPLQRGFDRYYGIIAGAGSYWKPSALRDGDTPVLPKDIPDGFYATDAFTTKAIEFIRGGDSSKPFFLYLAYNAPHAPFHAPEDEIAKHRGKYDVGFEVIRERRLAGQKQLGLMPPDTQLPQRDPKSAAWTGSAEQMKEVRNMEIYAAMVTRMDANIGRLTAFLKERGQLDNTLILFLSDNGAWASGATYEIEWAETGDTPFRLFKLFTHEGGIRTPFIAHWPGRVPAGKLQAKQYAHVKDILPTLLDAASPRDNETIRQGDDQKSPPPTVSLSDALPFSGRSFLPALLDPNHAANETLFWERLGNEAVRDGRWKLVRSYNDIRDYNAKTKRGPGSGERTGPWELYDLDTDPNETRDLATEHPDKVEALSRQHRDWAARIGVIPREVISARIKPAKP